MPPLSVHVRNGSNPSNNFNTAHSVLDLVLAVSSYLTPFQRDLVSCEISNGWRTYQPLCENIITTASFFLVDKHTITKTTNKHIMYTNKLDSLAMYVDFMHEHNESKFCTQSSKCILYTYKSSLTSAHVY